MDFEKADFTPEALDYSLRISNGIENLDGLFKSGKFKEPETNRTLVALLVVTRKMLDYVAPLELTIELMGKPTPVIYRRGDPSKDFAPWWQEKTSRLHDCMFKLALAASTPDDAVSQIMLSICLEESRHILGDLTDLLNSGGLVVSAVGTEEGDEEEAD